MRGRMSGQDLALSEYELARLERIKENQRMLDKLFPEGTGLALPTPKNTHRTLREDTPEDDEAYVPASPVESRRRLHFAVRRNPHRSVPSKFANTCCEYDGPVTRSMRSRLGKQRKGVIEGLSDEKQLRRVVYRSVGRKRKLSTQESLPIELDGIPGCEERMLKRVADNSKYKVYDKINGTTCHQCRQKTIDQKTKCHNKNCVGVRGQFCGPCLKNRYGENIRSVLLSQEWVCPPCRGVCNCSFCLPKKGRPPTGIMIHTAKEAGFDSVQEYLEKSNYDY